MIVNNVWTDLNFIPNFTFGQNFMLIEANSDKSSVGPSDKKNPILPDESALIHKQTCQQEPYILMWVAS